METPSLGTLIDIFNDAAATWYDCKPYAITQWAVELLFYMSLVFIGFYAYVISVIVVRRIGRCQFSNPFYNCVLLLSLGDIGTLLTCSRATIPTCALRGIPARYLAWEGVGVFCVDIIYGANLVMATIRLHAVLSSAKMNTDKSSYILNGFLLLEFVWATAMGTLYFKGVMRRIWFVGTEYHGEWNFPFDHRTQFNMGQMGLTFVVYVIAFFRLRKLKVSLSSTSFRQEYRLLLLAVLIFASELFFFYSSDWIGSVWGLGDADFNANISYFGRPLATGITPVFYLIFASDVRHACFPCLYWYSKNLTPSIQTTAPSPRRGSILILKNFGRKPSH